RYSSRGQNRFGGTVFTIEIAGEFSLPPWLPNVDTVDRGVGTPVGTGVGTSWDGVLPRKGRRDRAAALHIKAAAGSVCGGSDSLPQQRLGGYRRREPDLISWTLLSWSPSLGGRNTILQMPSPLAIGRACKIRLKPPPFSWANAAPICNQKSSWPSRL